MITIKRVWYLYIPDILLIIWIIAPPFSTEKLKLFIIAILLLGFRDISIIKQSQQHLESIKLKDGSAIIKTIRYSKVEEVIEKDINTLTMRLQKRLCCSYMDIYLDSELFHRQYAVGSYTFQKLHYLLEKVKQYQEIQTKKNDNTV